MIVTDANLWVAALTDAGAPGDAARASLDEAYPWLAPHHMPLEVMRTLTKMTRAKILDHTDADAFADAVRAADVQYEAHPARLLGVVWGMRNNVSIYDAAYVALALAADATLVTFDQRLATAAAAQGAAVKVPS